MKAFTNNLLRAAVATLLLSGVYAHAETAPAQPAAKKTADPIEQLKNWDKKLNSLQTEFTQITSYDGVNISRSQGLLYYDKAGNLLRLDTNNEDGKTEQTAVTDKKTLYILDDAGKDVMQLPWQEWQEGQPNKALFDFGNYAALLAQHKTSVFGQKDGNTILLLEPKQSADYLLYITLDATDLFPRQITIESDLMQTTATLSRTQKNTKLKTGLFGRVKK